MSEYADCNLRQGISCDGELADAYDSKAKLREGDDPAGKLADGDDSLGWHRAAVRPVLEGNVQQRQAQERCAGLVFKSPAVPFILRREGRSAVRTGHGLFGNLASAFSARLQHFCASADSCSAAGGSIARYRLKMQSASEEPALNVRSA